MVQGNARVQMLVLRNGMGSGRHCEALLLLVLVLVTPRDPLHSQGAFLFGIATPPASLPFLSLITNRTIGDWSPFPYKGASRPPTLSLDSSHGGREHHPPLADEYTLDGNTPLDEGPRKPKKKE
eukprot:scaffold48835_cov33-Tisochrysis_lutea.AAC.3